MKLAVTLSLLSSTSAFTPSAFGVLKGSFLSPLATSPISTRSNGLVLSVGSDPNVVTGNDWKPNPGGMQSTDVGDYFPEDYEGGPDFEEGMGGSQAKMGGGGTNAVETPGMEDFGKGGYVIGGIEDTNIPEGFEFVASSVSDGEIKFEVAGSSSGTEYEHIVKPFCMGFEDFYAGWAEGSSPQLTVSPTSGRMDRRGGEDSVFKIKCTPNGQAGTFTGKLVVFLPDEGDKLTYDVEVEAF